MFYRTTNKEKSASRIILTLTSSFDLSANEKNELVKNRNVRIKFLLLPLLPGFDSFLNSLKL